MCDIAVETLESMKHELDYSIDIKYIDGDAELENLYGEQVPVTQIDGEHHDFWRVDPERFRACLETHRQRQYFCTHNLARLRIADDSGQSLDR